MNKDDNTFFRDAWDFVKSVDPSSPANIMGRAERYKCNKNGTFKIKRPVNFTVREQEK